MSIYGGPDIITDGLVLHLDAANRKSYPGTGTTWYDLSGNGENFGNLNGASYNSLNRGHIAYDGSNDVTLSSTFFTGNYWADNDPWTVFSFHRIDSINLYASTAIIGSQSYVTESSPIGGFGLMLYTGNNPKRYVGYMSYDKDGSKLQYGFGGSSSDNYGDTIIDIGEIVCVAAVYNPEDNTGKLYKNGELASTTTNTAFKWTTRTSGRNTRIAQGVQGGWTNKWSGNINNVLLYNNALNAEEIRTMYQALKGRYGLT